MAYDKVCAVVIMKQVIANLFSWTHSVCAAFITVLKEKFADYNIAHSIGGQTPFSAFPTRWDKTYCL